MKTLPINLFLVILFFNCSCSSDLMVKWKYRNDYKVWSPDRKTVKKETANEVSASDTAEKSEIKSEGIETASSSELSIPETNTHTTANLDKNKTNNTKLEKVSILKLVKENYKKQSNNNEKEAKGRRPLFGVLSLSAGGTSVIFGLIGGAIPPFAIVWALMFLGAIVMGITSIALKEDKKGFAIAGLATAFFSIFILIGMYILVGQYFFF